MRDVARATSAAPTYFEPYETRFPTVDNRRLFETLIDGGIFANNPAMCAYAEARRSGAAPEDILIVSLGTGQLTAPLKHHQARDWGKLSWVEPLFRMIFDGASDTVDYQLRQLLDEEPGSNRRYYRFQPILKEGKDQMDDTSRTNLTSLKTVAQELIDTWERGVDGTSTLETLCEQLTDDNW